MSDIISQLPVEELDKATFSELVDRYGQNSNCFLVLYEGYRYFTSVRCERAAGLAYVESRYAWVAATEPVAAAGDWAILLQEFARAAAARGKLALCLPMGESGVRRARELGYEALKIGGEPYFWLDEYDPDLERISTAKRLHAKGAMVREFVPSKLTGLERAELDLMVEEWLASRKMTSLGFLNRVEPWTESARKKYFRVILQGRTLAFLATVPVPARNGWYFVDLIRWQDSPPGSVELLMLESMRLLKQQGAKYISLGVAPLSDLGNQPGCSHPSLNRILQLTYENGNLLYNFKSLHQFKLKFHPSGAEGAYLIFTPQRLGLRHGMALLHTFLGAGVSRTLWSGVERAFARFRPGDWLRESLVTTIVMRPPARGLSQTLGRLRVTLGLFCLNLFCYFYSTEPVLSQFAFSLPSLRESGISVVVFSPFLHWNELHLVTNLVSLLLFCGSLEYFAGSRFTGWVYGIGAFGSNLLTSLVIFFPLASIYPATNPLLESLSDVGASVGVLAGLGGLSVFFRRGQWPLIAVTLGIAFYTAATGDLFAINHIFAMILGNLTARWILFRPRRR